MDRGKTKEIIVSANKFEYEKGSEKIFELANELMSIGEVNEWLTTLLCS